MKTLLLAFIFIISITSANACQKPSTFEKFKYHLHRGIKKIVVFPWYIITGVKDSVLLWYWAGGHEDEIH